MTLKETLAQLKSLGNEKVRAHNKKMAPTIISLAFGLVISGSWLRRSRPTTS